MGFQNKIKNMLTISKDEEKGVRHYGYMAHLP